MPDQMTPHTQTYTTGDVARLCGISVRTVQYYDTRGLLCPSALSEGGRRLYSREDLHRMRIVCYLRELGLSVDAVRDLMREDNAAQVLELLLEEQEHALLDGIAEKRAQLNRIAALRHAMQETDPFTLDSISDVAHIVEGKKQLRRLHILLILFGLPITVMEWSAIILWVTVGIWWPCVLYAAILIPFAVWISRFYFARVNYICPKCHTCFKPNLRQAFWANHTPTTRKLTCPHCGHHGFCVETYHKKGE